MIPTNWPGATTAEAYQAGVEEGTAWASAEDNIDARDHGVEQAASFRETAAEWKTASTDHATTSWFAHQDWNPDANSHGVTVADQETDYLYRAVTVLHDAASRSEE